MVLEPHGQIAKHRVVIRGAEAFADLKGRGADRAAARRGDAHMIVSRRPSLIEAGDEGSVVLPHRREHRNRSNPLGGYNSDLDHQFGGIDRGVARDIDQIPLADPVAWGDGYGKRRGRRRARDVVWSRAGDAACREEAEHNK